MLGKDDVLVEIVEEPERFPGGKVAEALLVRSNVDSLKQDVWLEAS